MPANEMKPSLSRTTSHRAEVIYRKHLFKTHRQTENLFARRLAIEWLAGVAAALWISPRMWSGSTSQIHLLVCLSLYLGTLTLALPIYRGVIRPGWIVTRYVTAIGQMEKAQESNDHITRLLNSTAAGIYGSERTGVCTFSNAASLQILGYDHRSRVQSFQRGQLPKSEL